jgi:hypothetical protein
VQARLALPALLAALAAALIAGCGGGGGSSSGGTDPASVTPPKSPLYVGFTVRPEGETKANVEELAETVGGIDNLGEFIVTELEKQSHDEGEPFDYEKEIEPWLGKEGGVFAESDSGGNLSRYGVAVQVEDEGEAQAFVEKQSEKEDKPATDGSYQGNDFKIDSEGQAIGVFDGLLLVAEDEEVFKAAVDASEGESLGDQERFSSAVEDVPGASLAHVFVDIGGLIKQSGKEIDPQTQTFLETAGIEPKNATAVASLVPGSEEVEIDLATDVVGQNPPGGDASKTLEALPEASIAAIASPEFGTRFLEGIDRIDENGIPGSVPPHELKKALQSEGIDLDSIAGSIGNVGVFVEGNTKNNLSGALVLETKDSKEATNTVSNLGLFLRAAGLPGITAITGKATGFSVRSPELGQQPLVVAAEGSKIAVGYGLAAANAALAGSGDTLGDSPAYKEAVSALGDTPITGFVDGPAALRLASTLVEPGEEEGFKQAKPYLRKVDYVAIGAEASGDLAKAKMIVGVGK